MAKGGLKQVTDGMDATVTGVPEPLCKQCLSDRVEVKAKCYCVECKKYLCIGCIIHHLKSKVTSHLLVDPEQTPPADVSETHEESLPLKSTRDCHIHPGQAVEQFCRAHKVLCCSMCLADDHISCDTESISTVSNGYAKSSEFGELTGKLKELKTDVDEIITGKHTKAESAVGTFFHYSKGRLKTVAQTIVSSHIDATASKVKERIIEYMNSSKEKLQTIKQDIQHIQVSLDSITDDEEELFIRAIRENSKLREFEDVIKSYCDKLPTSWILYLSPDCDTILSSFVSLKPTTTTALRVRQPMESNCFISDIECFSDGRFVLVDSSNNALKLFKRNNAYQSKNCLQMRPLNIEEVEPGRLVVTLPEEKTIRFISVTDDLNYDVSLHVDDAPTGLATFGGKNFVSFMTHLRIFDRDGKAIERISRSKIGEELFVNLTCIMINDKIRRFYAVDNGRLAFIHVDSIRQMDTKNPPAVLLSNDGEFKPSMTFDEDNSLYVTFDKNGRYHYSQPECVKHFNPDLVELQSFAYEEFYTPISLPDPPSMEKNTATPEESVAVFPKYALGCHKSTGRLFIGGESDYLNIVHT